MTSGIGVSSRYDDGVNTVNGREASLATIVVKIGVSASLDELEQAASATMPTRRMRGRLIRLHARPRWEPRRGGCPATMARRLGTITCFYRSDSIRSERTFSPCTLR